MSNKLFTTVPVPKFPSNTFSLSRSVIFTPRLQQLYCTNVIENLPGDGINQRSEQFSRTQPMIAPTFAKISADQHAFFVPCWQLHEHFDEFITGGEDGQFNQKMPYTTVGNFFSYILNLLRLGQNSSSAAATFFAANYTASQYNIILEHVQSIIEHCDVLRAVPFVLPDFVEVSGITATDQNIVSANATRFQNLNSQLSGSSLRVNLLPFMAYLKVWCEYFRDENLCEDYFKTIVHEGQYGIARISEVTGQVNIANIVSVPTDYTDADSVVIYSERLAALFGVHRRAWKKDYFTAALPFTQKGPEVLLPLSGIFPVDLGTDTASVPAGQVYGSTGTDKKASLSIGTSPGIGITPTVNLQNQGLGSTIQDVRRAFRLEEFYEADGRGGNRYPENTLMQWGVRTPDSRLPRAIFLGSNSSSVQISEVVQNSSTANQPTPQGTLAGKGISYGNNRLSRYYYTMHGFTLDFFSLRVHAVYEQGIHPMFSRFDRTEYAWPRFAHLGEQPVYLKELFVDNTVTENEVFGYEPRYSEYKSEKSSVHLGLKGSLNYWTMSRRFASKPQLNEEFIYNSPRLDNFAVVNPLVAPFVTEIDYRVRANRKLPFFGVPML